MATIASSSADKIEKSPNSENNSVTGNSDKKLNGTPCFPNGGSSRSNMDGGTTVVEAGEKNGGLNSTSAWRCPDPGCKKDNPVKAVACVQCNLPRQSADQFKKGSGCEGKTPSSKVLKWL